MTDLLISTLMTGGAVFYALELIDLVNKNFFSRATMNLVVSAPLSLGCLWLFGYWDRTLIVTVPAATFVSLAINVLINRPTAIQQPRLPRLY
jgi:hypothetical protein